MSETYCTFVTQSGYKQLHVIALKLQGNVDGTPELLVKHLGFASGENAPGFLILRF